MGILAGTSPIPEDVREAIELYGHMLTSMHKVNDLRLAGKSSKEEENRFHRLEAKVNTAMVALPDEAHRLIVDKLVIQGLMPAEVKDIVQIFEGRLAKC